MFNNALDMIPPSLEGVRYGEMIECPKCGCVTAWFEFSRQDVHLRCLCGVMQLVATTMKQITIEHIESGDKVSLPRRDTKLWACLLILHGLKKATTHEITEHLVLQKNITYDSSDIASCLTVLRYKGLVVSLNKRKGFVGGSTWELTPSALVLLGE